MILSALYPSSSCVTDEDDDEAMFVPSQPSKRGFFLLRLGVWVLWSDTGIGQL